MSLMWTAYVASNTQGFVRHIASVDVRWRERWRRNQRARLQRRRTAPHVTVHQRTSTYGVVRSVNGFNVFNICASPWQPRVKGGHVISDIREPDGSSYFPACQNLKIVQILTLNFETYIVPPRSLRTSYYNNKTCLCLWVQWPV